MTRTAREISVYGFYHVVQKGCADQLIFEDDEDRLYLIRLIASKCQKLKWMSSRGALWITIFIFCLTTSMFI